MSFLDGGKPEPEWEEGMEHPVGRQTGLQCLGWALGAVAIMIALGALAFAIGLYIYLQGLPN